VRLDYVEISGFRGIKDKLRIVFGKGFTVISGRNGVGKSTIFDAIEFALTGSINKYTVDKTALESLSDYLWWRGEGTPDGYYVTVAFGNDSGEHFVVTRTRNTGANVSAEQIEDALCSDSRPEDALRQLCKTSIIRDEWIARLSVDLSETERFDLVRSALGSLEGSDLAAKAGEVIAVAKATHALRERAYEEERKVLADHLYRLSEAQTLASHSGDIEAAVRTIAEAVPNAPSDLVSRISAGRAALVERRAKLAHDSDAVEYGRGVAATRQRFNAPEARRQRQATLDALTTATAAKEKADEAVVQAEQALAREERTDETGASLALLLEHGERLGLHDARCPLCAAARTAQEFESGIALARQRINSLASGVATAHHALTAARANAMRCLGGYTSARERCAMIEREEADLVGREQKYLELIEHSNLDSRWAKDVGTLERAIAAERDRLIDLERALLTIEASQVVSRTLTMEDRTTALRRDVETAASELERSQAAVATARMIERSVKRVNAEIIEERLAQISPLLNELYQRLRPHADWRTIDYRLRGDVRRFLSLKVGDGLNPQFVLSSGQRRAAGLAFLLSVHLARAWARWRTLVLDDPVQHIDDFRALHFVEILAAFRLTGQQIVCAVEDQALANLLCRRLLSTAEQVGRYYEIDLTGPDGVAAVVKKVDILPLPNDVLQSGSGLQPAG
jgi:chromosome segregation protein